jgi:hypothetical protein
MCGYAIVRTAWHILPIGIRSRIGPAVEVIYSRFMRLADSCFDLLYGVGTQTVLRYTEIDRVKTTGTDPHHNIPTYYLRALALRHYLRPTEDDVFIDLGCGLGRMLFVFAGSSMRKIRGIEFDGWACEKARQNLQAFRGRREGIEIIQGDCATFQYNDETIVFLYNPFGEHTLTAALDGLRKSLSTNPRRLRICYFTAPLRRVLDNAEWLMLEHEIQFFKKSFLIYRAK